MELTNDEQENNTKEIQINQIRRVAMSAVNSISGIDKYNIELLQEEKEKIEKIRDELLMQLKNEEIDLTTVQNSITQYNTYATKIWHEYLSSVQEGQENKFQYLVHSVRTSGFNEKEENHILSTSLITDKTMGVFARAFGPIVVPKKILAAREQDIGINNYDGEENAFRTEPIIMLPHEIEEYCINETIEKNGEILTGRTYSEIALSDYEVVGVFFISNGERELAECYDDAKKIAEEQGVPLKELNMARCRSENGLEPINEKEQKDFCQKILHKHLKENGISVERGMFEDDDFKHREKFTQIKSIFVENNYKKFYEKYKQLTKNGEYGKEDILETFRKVILDYQTNVWKKSGMSTLNSQPFLKEFTIDDVKYINSTFAINEYEDYNDYKKQYKAFREFVKLGCSKSNQNEKLREYFNQKFGTDIDFSLLEDDEKIKIAYEKGVTVFDDILEKATLKELEEKQEQQENKEEKKSEENQEQQEDKEEKIERENDLSKQEPQKIIPKHMQANWTMKSIEEMEKSAGIVTKEVNENSWMNRFKNWYEQSERVPINERYTVSDLIVRAVKEINEPRITKETQFDR